MTKIFPSMLPSLSGRPTIRRISRRNQVSAKDDIIQFSTNKHIFKHIFLRCKGYFRKQRHPVSYYLNVITLDTSSSSLFARQTETLKRKNKMAYGPRVLGYVAMTYEDLVAEYRGVLGPAKLGIATTAPVHRVSG